MNEHKGDTRHTRLEDALAALIASTRRIRRKLNLLEIAEKLKAAQDELKSIKKVADAVGLSTEMLRQFSRVEKVAPSVRKLIAEEKLTGVDIVDRISRLPSRDQVSVAQAVVRGELNSDDVRGVVALRREIPDASIHQIIERIKDSRNIKEYVFEFIVPKNKVGTNELTQRFAGLMGKENILSLGIRKGVGTLVTNATGKTRVQDAARKRGLTKRALVDKLVWGEVE